MLCSHLLVSCEQVAIDDDEAQTASERDTPSQENEPPPDLNLFPRTPEMQQPRQPRQPQLEEKTEEKPQPTLTTSLNRSHVVLSCGHAYCTSPCLSIVKLGQLSDGLLDKGSDSVYCFVCESMHKITSRRIDTAHPSKTSIECEIHGLTVTHFCCSHKRPLCTKCMSTHKNCDVISDLDHAIRTKVEVSRTLTMLNVLNFKYERALECTNFQRSPQNAKTINSLFERLREALKRKEKEKDSLIQRLEKSVQDKAQLASELEPLVLRMQNLCKSLSAALEKSNTADLQKVLLAADRTCYFIDRLLSKQIAKKGLLSRYAFTATAFIDELKRRALDIATNIKQIVYPFKGHRPPKIQTISLPRSTDTADTEHMGSNPVALEGEDEPTNRRIDSPPPFIFSAKLSFTPPLTVAQKRKQREESAVLKEELSIKKRRRYLRKHSLRDNFSKR